jgi:histidyl-tRNA synthetase
VFEFHSARLGAQSQVAGGGRYDRLIELLGGPPTPANGWAAGIERMLLAVGTEEGERLHEVFVAAEDSQRERALALVTELRRAGLRADIDLAGRSMKGQMRQADRVGAGHTVILDADGSAQLRDMRSGEQREVDAAHVVEELGTG